MYQVEGLLWAAFFVAAAAVKTSVRRNWWIVSALIGYGLCESILAVDAGDVFDGGSSFDDHVVSPMLSTTAPILLLAGFLALARGEGRKQSGLVRRSGLSGLVGKIARRSDPAA